MSLDLAQDLVVAVGSTELEQLARVRDVPADRVRTGFAEVASDEGRVVLVVGDRRAIEPGLKALGIGEVRVIDPDAKPLAR